MYTILTGLTILMSLTFSQLCQNVLPELSQRVLYALAQTESNLEGFVGNRVKIRFENHIFLNLCEDAKNTFFTGENSWENHTFLTNEGIKFVHQNQDTEYEALKIASEICAKEAHMSISVGIFQIHSSNYQIIGFPEPFPSLFLSFHESDEKSCYVLKKFLKNQPLLYKAFVEEDLYTIAYYWNRNPIWLEKFKKNFDSYKIDN